MTIRFKTRKTFDYRIAEAIVQKRNGDSNALNVILENFLSEKKGGGVTPKAHQRGEFRILKYKLDYVNELVQKARRFAGDSVDAGGRVVQGVGKGIEKTGQGIEKGGKFVSKVAGNTVRAAGNVAGIGVKAAGNVVGTGIKATGKLVGGGVEKIGHRLGGGLKGASKKVGKIVKYGSKVAGKGLKTVGTGAKIAGKVIGKGGRAKCNDEEWSRYVQYRPGSSSRNSFGGFRSRNLWRSDSW